MISLYASAAFSALSLLPLGLAEDGDCPLAEDYVCQQSEGSPLYQDCVDAGYGDVDHDFTNDFGDQGLCGGLTGSHCRNLDWSNTCQIAICQENTGDSVCIPTDAEHCMGQWFKYIMENCQTNPGDPENNRVGGYNHIITGDDGTGPWMNFELIHSGVKE